MDASIRKNTIRQKTNIDNWTSTTDKQLRELQGTRLSIGASKCMSNLNRTFERLRKNNGCCRNRELAGRRH